MPEPLLVDAIVRWVKRRQSLADGHTPTPLSDVLVEVELPAAAIQLLYDVLGHFPHDPGSWSNDARAHCAVALMTRRPADIDVVDSAPDSGSGEGV